MLPPRVIAHPPSLNTVDSRRPSTVGFEFCKHERIGFSSVSLDLKSKFCQVFPVRFRWFYVSFRRQHIVFLHVFLLFEANAFLRCYTPQVRISFPGIGLYFQIIVYLYNLFVQLNPVTIRILRRRSAKGAIRGLILSSPPTRAKQIPILIVVISYVCMLFVFTNRDRLYWRRQTIFDGPYFCFIIYSIYHLSRTFSVLLLLFSAH